MTSKPKTKEHLDALKKGHDEKAIEKTKKPITDGINIWSSVKECMQALRIDSNAFYAKVKKEELIYMKKKYKKMKKKTNE